MKLAIIGAGEQANELYGLIKADNSFEDVIFVGLEKDMSRGVIAESSFFQLPQKDYEVIVAMGEPYMRMKMHEKYLELGYTFATYVHGSAVIGLHTVIGKGTIIMPFVYIAQDTIIRDNTLVHAGVRIENNCEIGMNSMISSGAFVGAKTRIGNQSFIGPNSSIKDNIRIGYETVIGMGSTVLHDVESRTVVVGNPARVLRSNSDGRVFSKAGVQE